MSAESYAPNAAIIEKFDEAYMRQLASVAGLEDFIIWQSMSEEVSSPPSRLDLALGFSRYMHGELRGPAATQRGYSQTNLLPQEQVEQNLMNYLNNVASSPLKLSPYLRNPTSLVINTKQPEFLQIHEAARLGRVLHIARHPLARSASDTLVAYSMTLASMEVAN